MEVKANPAPPEPEFEVLSARHTRLHKQRLEARRELTLRDLSEISRGEGGGNRGRVTLF